MNKFISLAFRQPGENLVVDVPSDNPAVMYVEDRWLNEARPLHSLTPTALFLVEDMVGGGLRSASWVSDAQRLMSCPDAR